MTEMNMIEICHRITNIQKVLETTKEFSLKFNSHMKLITELINSLEDEDEENMLLYEEKIEHKIDHYHQRIHLSTTKEGRDLLRIDPPTGSAKGAEIFSGNTRLIPTTMTRERGSDGAYREMTKSGMLNARNYEGDMQESAFKFRPSRWDANYKKGILSKSTRGRKGNLARSMDQPERLLKRGRRLSVGERRGAAGIHNTEFVREFKAKKTQGDESLRGSMTERFDMFVKDNDFLRKIIRNGEENAQHLKECLFKLIEMIKEKDSSSENQRKNVEKVEHIERIERVEIDRPKREDEEKTVDIKINHSFLNKQMGSETVNVQFSSLKVENERLKQRIKTLMQEKSEEMRKTRKAQIKGEEWELDMGKMASQVKTLKREKNELDEEVEELREKVRQWKKKYRDEAEKSWGKEGGLGVSTGWRNERKMGDLEDQIRAKTRQMEELRGESARLEKENRRLAAEIRELRDLGEMAEGDLKKQKEKGESHSTEIDKKNKMILKLVEYIEELKLTVSTLEEEVELMQNEIDKLSKTIRETELFGSDDKRVETLEKEVKMKQLTIRKLERKIKNLVQMQHLENKKTKGRQENLNEQIRHLKETKLKLDKKIVSLKNVNQRHSEAPRTSNMHHEKPMSTSGYKSRTSGHRSKIISNKSKYTSQSGKKTKVTRRVSNQKTFIKKRTNTQNRRPQAQIVQNRKIYRQYNSHTPIERSPYFTDPNQVQKRYPQAPKHGANFAKNGFFNKHSRPPLQPKNRAKFIYAKEETEAIEQIPQYAEEKPQEEEAEEAGEEKYVPVYMIGDQYIPVEEYNRLKMMGEIEDSEEEDIGEEVEGEMPLEEAEIEGEEEDEEEVEVEEGTGGEYEDEVGAGEYAEAMEEYRQQIEEYRVNGYSRTENREEEFEDEEGDGEEEEVDPRLYQQIVEQS